jgi:selenide,water dikinase
VPKTLDPRVLVGTETADDAGVYKLDERIALVQTVDFFTPVVDDPYTFGQIAAANALSDVYAMGGTPVTALNIVGFPFCSLPGEILAQILAGGQAKAVEAGVAIIGGHTIQDKEPKYGLAVTGVISPEAIYTNAQAQIGDYLVLTKSIGTGVVNTAEKAGMATEEAMTEAITNMTMLNLHAAQAMCDVGCHSCTDITGFGLIGHTYEMAAGSKVAIELYAHAIPIITGALDFASMGLVPGGAYANRTALQEYVAWEKHIPQELQDLLYDPQTSGGLLIAVGPEKLDLLLAALRDKNVLSAAVVGRVVPFRSKHILVLGGKMS